MSRLIVKNIPNQITETQLKQIFEKKGEITDVKIIFKGDKNRRFCFIGYKKQEDAEQAIKFFDKTFVMMSKVNVSWAKTKDDPNLPKGWSKHTDDKPQKKIKQDTKEPQPQELPKSEKFKEFIKLMKQTNTSAMAWNDNIDKGEIDNPKNRQKQLKLQKKLDQDKQQVDELFDQAKEEIKKVEPSQNKLASNVDEKRLYVTNIPYTSNEQEIRDIFSKYGTVVSLKLPKMRGGSLSGFCFVQYALPEEAMRAYDQLDNKIVLGRILHVRPAYEEDKKETEEINIEEKSSFKKYKKQELLERLEDTVSWNTLFLNPNTIVEYISKKYDLDKREILAEENEDMAVKDDWLKSIGLNIDFLKAEKGLCERSNVTIFVKNLQYRVDENDVHELFSRFGKVSNIYLAPNKALAVVRFEDTQQAQNAFRNLSYYKFKGSYLYLEWAPKSLMSEKVEQVKAEQPIQDQDDLQRIVYVKNLNFSTNEKQLEKLFSSYKIKKISIVSREGLSKGYGFVEFENEQDAQKAIKQLQNVVLENHSLQLSMSRPQKKAQTEKKQREEVEPTNKIVVRNVPFEANAQELRKLVKQYGEVKKLRLPKKLDGNHKGFAFVEFVNVEEAQNAYDSLQNTHFYGRRLVIEYSLDEEI
ncbi:hypothetical protein pb186bvf_000555 [Paramecium bursaria]